MNLFDSILRKANVSPHALDDGALDEGLTAIPPGALDSISAAYVAFVAMFATSPSLRKKARALMTAQGPEKARAFFMARTRSYAKITNPKSFGKAIVEVCRDADIDPKPLLQALLQFAQQVSGSDHLVIAAGMALSKKLKKKAPNVFELLADAEEIFLPPVDGEWPGGMGALRAMRKLVASGLLTSPPNEMEFAHSKLDEVWFEGELTSIAFVPCLRGLRTLRLLTWGPYAHRDIEALRECTLLEHLELVAQEVRDFDPLGSLAALRSLVISTTRARVPIGTLENLEYLQLNGPTMVDGLEGHRCLRHLVTPWPCPIMKAGTLARLPALTHLELTVSGTELPSIVELARSPSLQVLKLTAPPLYVPAATAWAAELRAAGGKFEMEASFLPRK